MFKHLFKALAAGGVALAMSNAVLANDIMDLLHPSPTSSPSPTYEPGSGNIFAPPIWR